MSPEPTELPLRTPPPFLAWPGWKHLRYAWLLSLAGTLWFVWVYAGANALTAHRSLRVRVHLDAELGIPFVPEAVLVYMSIYLLFLAAPFILRTRREFTSLSLALNLMILAAGICFLFLPAELAFAPPQNLGWFPGIFRFADRLNLTYNLVPSLHVALSTACIAAFATKAGPAGRIALWCWAAAIAASTLLTHQHHLVDVAAGLALAGIGFRFVYLARISPVIEKTAPAINS